MSCPDCGGSLRVTNLMLIKDTVTHTETLRRYRICNECGRRVTTDEKVVGADAAYVDALADVRSRLESVGFAIGRLEREMQRAQGKGEQK